MTARSIGRAAAALVLAAVVVVPGTTAVADEVRDAQWHLDFLDITEAHQYSQGRGVVVAVIDTGVDASHPDLATAVLPGIDLAIGDGGEGRTDTDGHGTRMAGLIAARGHGPGNDDGVLGIAPQVEILPVRQTVGAGAGAQPAAAIEWAVANGATVLCIAWAGSDDPALRSAIDAVLEADVVVVAAAGNAPDDTRVMWPAAYPGVVAAVGVDMSGNHSEGSVTGPEVTLAAPAADIVSTSTDGRYTQAVGTGTSSATAIVAGAAALVRARYPDLSAEEVVHRLSATADDRGPSGRDEQYGYGVIDIVAALTADVPPLAPERTEAPSSSDDSPPPAAAPPRDDDTGLPAGLPAIILGTLLAVGAVAVFVIIQRRR